MLFEILGRDEQIDGCSPCLVERSTNSLGRNFNFMRASIAPSSTISVATLITGNTLHFGICSDLIYRSTCLDYHFWKPLTQPHENGAAIFFRYSIADFPLAMRQRWMSQAVGISERYSIPGTRLAPPRMVHTSPLSLV